MESLSDWIPAFASTSLFAVILWLCRNWISTRLTYSIQHEYNSDIEKLRADLKKSEERFKLELQAKEAQIESIRHGALSGLERRHSLLFERRLKAVEELWKAVTELQPAKLTCELMGIIKFEEAAKHAAKDPKTRLLFESVDIGKFDLTKADIKGARLSRPFLSPMAWAYYSAYTSIIVYAKMQIEALKRGVDSKYFDEEPSKKLVKTALPHYNDLIDKYGTAAYHLFLDELENKILDEIGITLKGDEWSKESIKQAADIVEQSEKVINSVEAAKKETGGIQ